MPSPKLLPTNLILRYCTHSNVRLHPIAWLETQISCFSDNLILMVDEFVFFIKSSNMSSINAGAKGLYGFLGGSGPGNLISCIDNFASFLWRSFRSAGVTSLDMVL